MPSDWCLAVSRIKTCRVDDVPRLRMVSGSDFTQTVKSFRMDETSSS